VTLQALRSLRDPNLYDPPKFLSVYYDTTSISRNALLTIELIEVFRDLLARRSNDTGDDFMTDIDVNDDPARVGRTETISQIH